jgi:hypothetical protein
MMVPQSPANRSEDRDPLDARVASYARLFARGALGATHEAIAANAVRLHDLGDREAARAVLEEFNLMPGQPIGEGSASFSVEEIDL